MDTRLCSHKLIRFPIILPGFPLRERRAPSSSVAGMMMATGRSWVGLRRWCIQTPDLQITSFVEIFDTCIGNKGSLPPEISCHKFATRNIRAIQGMAETCGLQKTGILCPLYGRPTGSGPVDPHQRRAAAEQLPALAVGGRGTGVLCDVVARLLPRRFGGSDRRLPAPDGRLTAAKR